LLEISGFDGSLVNKSALNLRSEERRVGSSDVCSSDLEGIDKFIKPWIELIGVVERAALA